MTVAPASSATVRELILKARETHEQVRVVGRGQWLDAGRPVTTGRALDVSAHTGIVEYVPGDLTLTARGGTTLAEIASATAAHGQWLALDPFGTPDGTIGATVASAVSRIAPASPCPTSSSGASCAAAGAAHASEAIAATSPPSRDGLIHL